MGWWSKKKKPVAVGDVVRMRNGDKFTVMGVLTTPYMPPKPQINDLLQECHPPNKQVRVICGAHELEDTPTMQTLMGSDGDTIVWGG